MLGYVKAFFSPFLQPLVVTSIYIRSQIKEPVKEKVATSPEKKADEVAVKKVEEVSKSAEVAVKLERGEEGKHVR